MIVMVMMVVAHRASLTDLIFNSSPNNNPAPFARPKLGNPATTTTNPPSHSTNISPSRDGADGINQPNHRSPKQKNLRDPQRICATSGDG
ncbi:hypothetical protein NONO_c72960 [Nocardia nova SH22a]|uniref:Uncharacterized protein n=1 Tax=Nocardia nova SH22a TaxID=1415166 RepID=W5TT17_9NOCA|nr:hypothetical protein NONO_c72960 [Nocardia nova SH22a]